MNGLQRQEDWSLSADGEYFSSTKYVIWTIEAFGTFPWLTELNLDIRILDSIQCW